MSRSKAHNVVENYIMPFTDGAKFKLNLQKFKEASVTLRRKVKVPTEVRIVGAIDKKTTIVRVNLLPTLSGEVDAGMTSKLTFYPKGTNDVFIFASGDVDAVKAVILK